MSKKNNPILKVILGIIAIIIVISGVFILKNNFGDNGEHQEVVGEHEHEHNHEDEEDEGYIEPSGYENRIFGSGDFVLTGPQVYILEDVKSTYEEFKLENNIDEVVKKVGEPVKVIEGKLLTGYTFSLEDGKATLKVTIDNKTRKILLASQ